MTTGYLLLWLLSLYVAYRTGNAGVPDIIHNHTYHTSHLLRELRLLQQAHNRTIRKMKTYKRYALEHGFKSSRSTLSKSTSGKISGNASATLPKEQSTIERNT